MGAAEHIADEAVDVDPSAYSPDSVRIPDGTGHPVLEAIDAAIMELDAMAGKLRVLRRLSEHLVAEDAGQLTIELNGSLVYGEATIEPVPDPAEPEPSPPFATDGIVPPPIPEPEPGATERKSTAPPRRQTERPNAAQRNGTAKATTDRDDRAREIIRERPGLKMGELAEALGVDPSAVTGIVKRLTRHGGGVRTEKGAKGAKHLYPREHEAAPADAGGCKTDVERKVVDALQRATGPLTEVAVEASSGVKRPAVVLQGLVRRGVLVSTTDGNSRVWSPA